MDYRLLIGFLIVSAILIAWERVEDWLLDSRPDQKLANDFCDFCGHEKTVSQIEGFTLICADCRVENV